MSGLDAKELRATYAGKKVLLTGHTGFKGAWLTLWLERLGAKVHGFSLAPEPKSVFLTAGVEASCVHRVADVRQFDAVRAAIAEVKPDVVFHLAAQALVRPSYADPLGTIATNINGTAHVLEAIRQEKHRCAVVIVSSDKCYENREWVHGYREDDAMGGHDPYSMSKGATELVTSSWRRSFFSPAKLAEHGVAIGSARAGNVIGGGDWAADRIVPDCIRALHEGKPIGVRSPKAVRPWQHVLEPLAGYLELALAVAGDAAFARGWNFGPDPDEVATVEALAREVARVWGDGRVEVAPRADAPKEAPRLSLDAGLARARLGWRPRLSFAETVAWTVEGYRSELAPDATVGAVRAARFDQIDRYMSRMEGAP